MKYCGSFVITHELSHISESYIQAMILDCVNLFCRYWQLVPESDSARERIKDLEQRLEEASKNLEEQESKARETYKQMYEQGKEAAKLERDNVVSKN